MLPQPLRERLEEGLGSPILRAQAASGGRINQAAALKTERGLFFVKWNEASPPGFFEKEAAGLRLLRSTKTIRAPEPLVVSEKEEECPSFLLMEHIQTSRAPFQREVFGQHFGKALAALHKNLHEKHGLHEDNYLGTSPQTNAFSSSWSEFFANARIRAQIDAAPFLKSAIRKKLETFCEKLPELLPSTVAPSLLHGDLWSGNYMIGPHAEPVLIDPAVYYGDREVDLAFTHLFGGFPASFYRAYNEAWPMEPGFEERQEIYQVYPLLVHANLFGGGYWKQLSASLERWI